MSGKLIVRRSDGTIETLPVTRAVRIGSSPQSDLRIDGEGVLPVHAEADVDNGTYWLRAAGDADVSVNGVRSTSKRALRHLDVITIGSSTNAIFSTTVAAIPAARSERSKPASPPATATGPQPTMVFRRSEMLTPPPSFRAADADQPDAPPPETIVGIPPVNMPTLESSDPPNTMMFSRTREAAPAFRPPAADNGPNTSIGQIPIAPPRFDAPVSSEEAVTQEVTPPPLDVPTRKMTRDQSIVAVLFRGNSGVLTAPFGRSVIGRGSSATIRIDSDEVSKVHAWVDVTATDVTITDQKSINGTAVNGSRISGPRKLVDGDRVTFAKVEFRVELVRRDGNE